MRVALITETFLPDVNGVVTTLCRLLEHLRARGHEALLFAPEGAPASYAGAEIVPLRGMPLPLYPDLKLTPPQFGFSAQLRRFQPDVIHLAGLVALGSTGRFVADRFKVPLIGAYHTNFPAYSAMYGMSCLQSAAYRYLRWVHHHCALTLCPSAATIADLRQHGFQRLRLWGRGVDTERFHPRFRSNAWRAAVGAQPGETVLLYAGRLAAEKRIDLLAPVLTGMPNVRLVLVGDGPARTALEQRFAGLPVHMTGFLRGEELATAYASADMFVFPSDTDTFGQVIQEAMASGLPVVAANAGGAPDLVREGSTGTLFAPGDGHALRTQIAALPARCSAPSRCSTHLRQALRCHRPSRQCRSRPTPRRKWSW